MLQLIWTKFLIKTLATVGSSILIISYKLDNDLFHAYASDENDHVPKRSIPWNHNWDKDEPCITSFLKSVKSSTNKMQIPTAKRNIILIRHGDYEKNHLDGSLTEKGSLQAKLTGIKLKTLGHKYSNVLNTSTMVRAMETSEIIRRRIPSLKVNALLSLCEGFPNNPVPRTSTSLIRPLTTMENDRNRLNKVFCNYFRRAHVQQNIDSFELMVCHSNVIRYFVCRALQFPPEAWLRLTLGHCSITWLVIHPNGHVELKTLGDVEHLPSKLISY